MATWLLCSRLHAAENLNCPAEARCKQLQEQGISAHNKLQYAQAVELYERAFARVADLRLLVLIGRSKFKLGAVAEAVALYDRALPGVTDAGERARLDRFRADADKVLSAPNGEPFSPVTAAASSPSARPRAAQFRPLYKKWWFWTGVGVATVGTVTVIGIGAAARGPDTRGIPEYPLFP